MPACEEIWRDGLNDYLVPLGQMEIPPDNPTLRLLHEHALATDPERFWVATRPSDDPAGGEAIVGFASAFRRGDVWFLSMLFVRPGRQLGGIGRALIERTLPAALGGVTLAVATDAAQPISNGLYASFGMAPRMPMFNIVGRPFRTQAMPELPDGIVAGRFDASSPAERDRSLEGELAALDRELLGYAHPEDHGYVQRQGRIGFGYRNGDGTLLGYGYTSEVGRIGPIAVADAGLQAAVTSHLLRAIPPRGASAIWVPGEAAPTLEMLLAAGLRIEGFPVLLCWSRPFVDFSRYLPIGPGIL